nr:alpha/beta fold hydrolase [uncultured Roseibium sp.]
MAEAETGSTGEVEQKTAGARAKLRGGLVKLLIAAAIAYSMAAGYMYLNQRSFIFVPSGELATPEDKGLQNVSVELVEMADGTRTTVWTAEPAEEGLPTVVYFHGNSSNLSGRWQRFKMILDSGYGLYAPTYRGYAGSEGSPSETAIISDALEHFDRAASAGTPIIVHGESLGSGVATAVAAERPDTALLVLEAPYTALVDMAAASYPWLPVGFLMKDQMKTRERIGKVEAPALIIHGTEDAIIPVEHGEQVFQYASEPKELLIFDGAGHGDLWKRGLWDSVRDKWTGEKP